MAKKIIKAAIIQLSPGFNKNDNIKKAVKLIKAAAKKSKLIILPEMFYFPYQLKNIKNIADNNNETSKILKELATELSIYLCSGSTAERNKDKIYNTSILYGPNGKILLKYRKTHLFDIKLNNTITESSVFESGNMIKTIKTDLGKIGILICYDIRFPEIVRKISEKKIDLLIVPAAFSSQTGKDHWNILLQSRAIENQIFIAAAAPAPTRDADFQTWGHSAFIDPWGKIISQAGKKEKIIYADLDFNRIKTIRNQIPVWKQRRTDLY